MQISQYRDFSIFMHNAGIGAAAVKGYRLLLIGSRTKIKSNSIESKGMSSTLGTSSPPT